jgi:hypothetical protein
MCTFGLLRCTDPEQAVSTDDAEAVTNLLLPEQCKKRDPVQVHATALCKTFDNEHAVDTHTS